MYVSHDGEKLYLNNWKYNACRIFSSLAVVIENNGGTVKPIKNPVIVNRTLMESIAACERKLEAIENYSKPLTDQQKAYAANQRRQLEEMQAINNDPIEVTSTGYISFVLDDIYYYYQTSDNPFFPFHYIKTPVINGKISKDAVLEEDPKEWLFDCVFSFNLGENDVKEIANMIFNMLYNAKNSTKRRDGKRIRVPNTYSDGYHYETIYTPERWESVEEWNK